LAKKILIFGATGGIGSIIINNLKNYEIVGASPDYEEGSKRYAIRFYDHDKLLNDDNNIDFFIKEKFDVIINCAGHNFFDKWTEEKKNVIYFSRIDTCTKLLDIVQKMPQENRPEVIIFASSVAAYANAPERVDEYTKLRKDINYFKSIIWYDMEKEILEYNIPGTRIIIPRYGVVMAPVSYVKTQFTLSKYYLNGYLTNKNPIVSWVSHKDIHRIIELFISNRKLSGIFNVCSPNTVTSDEFARAFAKVMNTRILYRIPTALLRLVFGQRAKIFEYPLNVYPRRLQEANYQWADDNFLNALYSIKSELFN
jgi:uncharacterized protein (TIGR01777 family)